MSTPIQPWTFLVVAVAGWIQRDQQAAIVYLLEENKSKARLRGRKLRFTDDERRRLAVRVRSLAGNSWPKSPVSSPRTLSWPGAEGSLPAMRNRPLLLDSECTKGMISYTLGHLVELDRKSNRMTLLESPDR